MLAGMAFYTLAAVAVVAALGVVSSRNPVHSVLFLILTFFTAAGLFVLIGAEFLAMLLVVVYVGAVAVLFLFVVMMLDVYFVELRQGFLNYLPLGALIALVLLGQIGLVASAVLQNQAVQLNPDATAQLAATNAEAVGSVLYTRYVLVFQLSGLVLFVAMIGAIVLTLRSRVGVKKQSVSRQVGRRRQDAVGLKDVRPGQGLG